MNTHNCRLCGSEKPCASLEHVCDGSELNFFLPLSKFEVVGPFFFMDKTIYGIMYLDILNNLLIPQLDEDDQDAFTSSKTGCP